MKTVSTRLPGLLFATIFFPVMPATADNLRAALADAYTGNATMQVQRSDQRETDEQLPEAESGWRPNVNVSATVTWAHQYFGLALGPVPNVSDLSPRTYELTLDQPIYRGGSVGASIDRANATIDAGAARLSEIEQQQLMAAAAAYLALYRDKKVIELSDNLVSVLGANQHDVLATFKAGAATETDTSQASARLSGADASKLDAEARFRISLAQFQAVVGRGAGVLDSPELLGELPVSEDEAVAQGLQNNPEILGAQRNLFAAQKQVDIAEAALLPRVDGIAQLVHQDDELIKGIRQNLAQVGVQASVPLYQGGGSYAQIRAAKEAVNSAATNITVAERDTRQQVVSAWNALQAAKAQRTQYQSQIDANDIALRDTGKEVSVGTRTRLDVLNAQQELFSSRVELVGAEHDILLASYQLQLAIGVLTPSHLNLGVPDYDPQPHRAEEHGKWWGTGISE